MKTILLTAVSLICFAGAAQASSVTSDHDGFTGPERVSEIHAFRSIDGWRPIDDDTLIVWATPFRPYLLELSRRSFDLRFADVIGVTSTAGTVYEKFDDIVVGGLRYPIKAIYKLDPESARHMKPTSSRNEKPA